MQTEKREPDSDSLSSVDEGMWERRLEEVIFW